MHSWSSAIVERVVPARLGPGFRWLLAATVVNNAGDGVVVSAGPLLVASQTRDPFLVSLAILMEYLPALIFGVVAGAAADRFDRRRQVVIANVVRAVVLAVLVAAIVTGRVNIAIVLGALFLLGTAETFADSASSTLVPNLVPSPDLGAANARLQGGLLLTNQLLMPPIGAFLFVLGIWLPFAFNAVAFAFGAILVSRIVVSMRSVPKPESWRADMAEGIRWLVAHPPMRTLALTIVT
ncbi:MAG TPA: MFS transporter, partial [Candidatus Limnocylindrales bacterium]